MHAITWKLRVLAPGQVGRHIVVRAAADYDCVRVFSVMHACVHIIVRATADCSTREGGR